MTGKTHPAVGTARILVSIPTRYQNRVRGLVFRHRTAIWYRYQNRVRCILLIGLNGAPTNGPLGQGSARGLTPRRRNHSPEPITPPAGSRPRPSGRQGRRPPITSAPPPQPRNPQRKEPAMSLIDPDDWYTGEYAQQVEPQRHRRRAPRRARPRTSRQRFSRKRSKTSTEDIRAN